MQQSLCHSLVHFLQMSHVKYFLIPFPRHSSTLFCTSQGMISRKSHLKNEQLMLYNVSPFTLLSTERCPKLSLELNQTTFQLLSQYKSFKLSKIAKLLSCTISKLYQQANTDFSSKKSRFRYLWSFKVRTAHAHFSKKKEDILSCLFTSKSRNRKFLILIVLYHLKGNFE